MESLLGGSNLNYVGHWLCVRKASSGAWKERYQEETVTLGRRKEEVGVKDRIWIERATRSGAWITDAPNRLNGADLSQE